MGDVQKYQYDANGNAIQIGGSRMATTTVSYDYENRLTGVSNPAPHTYICDGDGNLVKRDTTVLIGNYYEQTNTARKLFYYSGGVRIAVRPDDNVVRWILSDHLSSTAKTVSSAGATEGEQRYMPLRRLRAGSSAWLATRPARSTRPTATPASASRTTPLSFPTSSHRRQRRHPGPIPEMKRSTNRLQGFDIPPFL